MFKGGVEEAAKMLQGLGQAEAKKLLEQIRLKDPKMANELEKRMVNLEDLVHCTPAQLVGLLRDLNLEKFGLALRLVDKSISVQILSMVSTGIRLDIEDGLNGPPRPMNEAQDALNETLALMKKKIEQGHLVLNPQDEVID